MDDQALHAVGGDVDLDEVVAAAEGAQRALEALDVPELAVAAQLLEVELLLAPIPDAGARGDLVARLVEGGQVNGLVAQVSREDLVTAMLDALVGEVRRCRYVGAKCVPDEAGRYCYAPGARKATLGEIVRLLTSFRDACETLEVPNLAEGSFSKKLYSTLLSYYEPGRFAYDLAPNVDARGSFTEFLRTPERGQVSVNVSKPGITKGNHWHMSKWEKFLVVSGTASIKLRKVGCDAEGNPFPVDEYVVSGSDLRVVEMIPGYTHSITNLSDTDDLVTVIWANEPFDPENPDTYFEEV